MLKHLLAIDVGTQSVRAAILTENFDILAIKQIKQEIDSPQPGWAQQSPTSWWDSVCSTTGHVLKSTGIDPSSLAAVAVCGQMHGPVGIDASGEITTPWVQLWCDKRCQPQCEQVLEAHDETRLQALSANLINPAWTGCKVLWHKDNQPDLYERTACYLVPKDFINFQLTGMRATDPSEASGSFLWDFQANSYSEELAKSLGVDLNKFAPVRASHSVIGAVTEKAARLTGIPSGTPVVTGGGDFPVSMLGFGIVSEGIAADVTGTSSLFATCSSKPLIHPAVQNLRHVVDGWIPFTILDCGGLSMKWCKDLMSSIGDQELSFERLVEMAAPIPAGSEGLLYYPYLLGERRRENVNSRGGLWGMTLRHTAPHFIRAVMEGVALSLGRDARLFKQLGIPLERVLCVGGGTRNDLWNQIKADVLQMPFNISDEPEAGLKGAALLAAAGVGLIRDHAREAEIRGSSGHSIQPDAGRAGVYQETLDEFERLYNHMLGYWK